MKIVFMTSGTVTSSISYRALAIAKELVKMGNEVYIFSPKFDKYSKFKNVNVRTINGVTVINPYQLKKVPFIASLASYILFSIYKLTLLQPDVVHIYKANPITISGFTAKLFGKKVVLDIDDLDAEVMKIEKSPFLMVKLVELSTQFACTYASAITVASSYLRRIYKLKYKNKSITIVSNGAEFTQKLKLNKRNKRKVVFLGNMNRKNILEPLFYAAKELINKKIYIDFLIIGDGTFLTHFKKLVRSLKISSNVTFTGYVNQKDLGKFIHAGDLGYCIFPNEPTTKACSSMKVFQYLQYGSLPLVNNVGDLSKYIYSGKSGYLTKGNDAKTLSQSINTAIVKDKDWTKKVKNISDVKNKYSWQSLAANVLQTYNNI